MCLTSFFIVATANPTSSGFEKLLNSPYMPAIEREVSRYLLFMLI
jgi:hypothetical protein